MLPLVTGHQQNQINNLWFVFLCLYVHVCFSWQRITSVMIVLELSWTTSWRKLLEGDSLKETGWRRLLEGDSLKETAWRRLLEGDCLKETAWRRQLEGDCLKETGWRRLLEGDCLKETAWRRLLEGDFTGIYWSSHHDSRSHLNPLGCKRGHCNCMQVLLWLLHAYISGGTSIVMYIYQGVLAYSCIYIRGY